MNILLILFLALNSMIAVGQETPRENWENICGPYFIKDKGHLLLSEINFSSNELLLICGEETPGWSQIPRWQALSNTQNFLRSRGYYKSRVVKSKDKFFIDPGLKQKIIDIDFQNVPEHFNDVRFLGVDGKILNSNSLDLIEAWSLSRMRALGYPCPSLEIKGDPQTGQVIVVAKPGVQTPILSIDRGETPGIHPQALSRYDAFSMGDLYNGDLLTLSSRRLMQSGIVDYADFNNNCYDRKKQKGHFKQRLTFSQPRRFIFSFGASTEELPIVKLSWKHKRLDKNASQLSADLYLSPVKQSLSANSHWHIFKNYPRLYLLPEVEVKRTSEQFYVAVEQKLSGGLGYIYDDSHRRVQMEASPTYNVEETIVGEGPEHTSYFSLESQLSILSHDFEFYQQSPRSGYLLRWAWNTRRKGLGSSISGDKYLFSGTYLVNWGGFDPPLYVLGFRFEMAALVTEKLEDSPQSLRIYLGGDHDLRGFSRKSINNGGMGFTTSSSVGVELRVIRFLPWGLQPFIFVDGALVGLASWTLDSDIFWSPGLGLRWQSPFGTLRGTAGHGFVTSENKKKYGAREEWTYFVSFGQEF